MTSESTGIAGIILAAGEGKRIGKNKALLEIGGIKSLEKVATCMCGAGCDPVIVVGGAEADSVSEEAARLGVRFIQNENWQRGQFSSLKVGTSQLASVVGAGRGAGTGKSTQVGGAMVALVDHPLVKRETYQVLVGTSRKFSGRIIVPTYQERRGHPVVVPRDVMTEIVNSPDGMTLRDIIRKHDHLVLEQAVDDAGILTDIDTEADLRRAG
ncbi:MAG: nucleotidyltransferase family protein [Candidatus Eisenbacteria bacterium]|nr:nucleotidyltransferase family protein [Candidatus Eisenbacteria bacterium]